MSIHDDSSDSSPIPADQGQCLSLHCKRCPRRDGHIRLEFTVDDERKLLVNGFELFPGHGEDHEPLMTATVHDDGANATELHEETISYELRMATKEKDETERIELIDVDYEIRQVGLRVVKGIPTVHVRLIKLPTEAILVGILTTSEDYGADCGAVQCWAYRLTFGALGSGGDVIPQCCSRSSSQANHTSSDVNWRHPPNWEKILPPGLQFSVCACLLLALLAMFYFKGSNSSQKRGKNRGARCRTIGSSSKERDAHR